VGARTGGVRRLPGRRAAAACPGESELAARLRLDDSQLDRKIVALRAQASQTTALFAALGEERVRRWWSTETFVAADAASSGRRPEWGTWRVAA
jgi:hypothetical protein